MRHISAYLNAMQNDMAYDIEDQQLHQQAVTVFVSFSAVVSLGKACKAEFVGLRKTVIVYIEISDQRSVGHP
jgi:hypothetical protein